jgi:hypothetical protein
MSGNKISISSRVLVRLLAGELSYEEFDRDHMNPSDNRNIVKDFFIQQRMQGKMLENVVVEKCPEKDDDWINFEFGYADAAISKYK